VLVTVTDKKNGVSSPSDSSLIDHYEPDIVSAQDYYPFGMLQPGRSYLSPSGDKYRYGFNDKENDNEVKGDGNQQDYGMRVYDPRIGKFLSVDPLTNQYPELTPYQFAGGNPISGIDLDGGEYSWFVLEKIEKEMFGTTYLKEVREGFVGRATETVKSTVHFVKKSINTPYKYPTYGEGVNNFTLAPIAGVTPQNFEDLKKKVEQVKGVYKSVANEYKTLTEKTLRGDGKAAGALAFEALMFVLPGGEEIDIINTEAKALKYSSETVEVYSAIVKNSGGQRVIRSFVRSEDDLLKIAEDFAGGSLDKFTEIKPNWWEGEINGKKLRIEWQPGGEPVMGEGPHVKIMEWNPNAAKKGKWQTVEKYFQLDHESLRKIDEVKKGLKKK
jgi:RHS repeat-associated protein